MSDASIGVNILVPRTLVRRRVRTEYPAVDSPLTWITAYLSVATARWRSRRAMSNGQAAATLAQGISALSDLALSQRRDAARSALRARGMTDGNVIDALAIAAEYAHRILKLAPFTEQLACASALVRGAAVEMETGEGKTLAAFLAATVFGLAGRATHIVTANDYLANRDGEDLRDAYATLGLSVGIVVGGDTTAKRQDAYRADVVYISSKEVAFDYLRDGLMRSGNANNPNLAAKLSRVFTIAKVPHPPSVQRGLDVAIVDEIDSVLIDDAGTPLLISTNRTGEISEDVARTGLELANRYTSGSDFVLDAHDLIPSLTARGLRRLEDETAELSGPWRVRLIREELIRAAIASLHVLKRDQHYLVRDGKIVLIDPHSGRATPDRHWSHSLSLMVEVKEGCVSSGEKKSLASISFQRFFRGYATISGMSGTVREVAVELRAVYGLKPARIKRRLSLRRDYAQRRICSNRDELWAAAAQAAARLYAGGQPALVAVRSVGEANRASMALTTLGVPHRVLSAAQDAAEAEVVAHAGGRGAITVVTNMAGRGTDIRLGAGVAELGGLVVVICERHDSRRVDRQLVGRCARQGDPGLVMEFVSPEDSAVRFLGPLSQKLIVRWPQLTGAAIAWAQYRADARHMRARLQLLRRDEQLSKIMAFAGGLD